MCEYGVDPHFERCPKHTELSSCRFQRQPSPLSATQMIGSPRLRFSSRSAPCFLSVLFGGLVSSVAIRVASSLVTNARRHVQILRRAGSRNVALKRFGLGVSCVWLRASDLTQMTSVSSAEGSHVILGLFQHILIKGPSTVLNIVRPQLPLALVVTTIEGRWTCLSLMLTTWSWVVGSARADLCRMFAVRGFLQVPGPTNPMNHIVTSAIPIFNLPT